MALQPDEFAKTLVLEHFKHLGISYETDGVGFVVGGKPFEVQCQVEDLKPWQEHWMTVIGYRLKVDESTWMQEKVTGIGETAEQAVAASVCDWACGMASPIFELYSPGSTKEDYQPLTLYSQVGDTVREWNVVMGPVQANDREGNLFEHFKSSPPLALVLNTVTNYLNEERLHWVKVYMFASPNGDTVGEVRINNAVDDYGCEELEQFVWPTKQRPIWFRQFTALLPGKEVPPEEFQKLVQSHAAG